MSNSLGVFIVLTIYLVGLSLLLGFIKADVPISITDESHVLCKSFNPLTWTCTESTFIGNFVTNLSEIPLWINTIMIVIPLILWLLSLILLFVHG